MTNKNADAEDYITSCVAEMQELRLDEYGFQLIRSNYDDEGLWKAFEKDWEAELQKGIAGAPAGCADAMKSLEGKVRTRFGNDKEYATAEPAGVSLAFQKLCLDESDDGDEEENGDEDGDDQDMDTEDEEGPDANEMGPGMIRSMCLMADEGSLRSMSSSSPYVIAVDVMLHTGIDLGYPGYFKVAISSLMPKFYAAVGRFDSADVAAAVDADGIWRNMRATNASKTF